MWSIHSNMTLFFHASRYLKQTTFSYNAVFAFRTTPHQLISQMKKNPHAVPSECNNYAGITVTTQSTHARAHTSWTREQRYCNLCTWSPSKTGIRRIQYTWTERFDGRTLREQMETTCPHEHKTLWQRLLFKKWSSKRHDMPRLSRRSKTKGLSGTLFFSRPFRAFLRPFRAFSRPFRAKLLDNFWSYQAT